MKVGAVATEERFWCRVMTLRADGMLTASVDNDLLSSTIACPLQFGDVVVFHGRNVDYFAEALMTSACVRRDVLGHWGSWFDTLAKGRAKVGSAAWNYDGRFFTQVGTQCPVVLKQCARAASILLGRTVIYGAKSPGAVRNPRRPTAANRDDTGRRVTLQLTHSVAEKLALVRPALQDRAKHETSAEGSVTNRSEKLLAYAERDLRALHTAATNGTLTFTEYIAPEGRLGYDCAGYCGIKGILRELRPILFPCMWRVDVRRCHTTMLRGAHARAVSLQSAPDDHLLRRMRTDMGGIESELRSGQQGLLESARTRLEHAHGSDGEENARKFLGYLQMVGRSNSLRSAESGSALRQVRRVR